MAIQHHDAVDAAGSRPARPDWAALYQRYRETMLRVAASLLRDAGRDTNTAQDIVQQVFTEVMKNPPATPGNWEAYLVKATGYRAKDHMSAAEARRAFPAGSGSEDGGTSLLEHAADSDVEEQALRALHTERLRHRLREILARMPSDQNRVIRLRLFEKRSNVEIAPLLGVSPQRVSQLWKQGFVTLWTELHDDPELWLEDE